MATRGGRLRRHRRTRRGDGAKQTRSDGVPRTRAGTPYLLWAGRVLSLTELLHLYGYTNSGYTHDGRQGTLSELLHLFEPTPLLSWLRTGQLPSMQGRLECVSATLLALLQHEGEATHEGEAVAKGTGAAAKATTVLGRLREEGENVARKLSPFQRAEGGGEGGAEGRAASQLDGGFGHGGTMERRDIHWRLCKLLPLVVDMFVEERESGVRVLVRALGGLVELERRVRAGSREDLGEQAGSHRALGLASGVERSTHSGASPSSPSSPSRPSSPQARHQDILPRHPTMRQPAIAPTPPHPPAPKPAHESRARHRELQWTQ